MSKDPVLAEDMERLRDQHKSHWTPHDDRSRTGVGLSVNDKGSRAAMKSCIG